MRPLSLHGCVVDLDTGAVSGGWTQHLTTRELVLLGYLAERPGQDVSREALLVEAFGYAESASSRAVDKAMTSLRAKVEVDRSAPEHLITVVGYGYRFVPPPAPQPTSSRPLPAERGAFVGRADDLQRLRSLVGPGLLTLVGAGGIGKTRLALQLARERPGSRLVELAGARSREDILRLVGSALDLPLNLSGTPPAEQIGHALAALGPALVVLDNLEHLLEHAPLLSSWLALAPSVHLLATSRRPLDLAGERVHRVEPLEEEDALALLAERARQRGLDPSEEPALGELCRSLDGLPLALELAAARLGSLGATELRQRLHERLTLLRSRDKSAPERHTTLAAMLDWSWSLLDGVERTALAELSVFPSDFTAEAAEAALSPPADGRPALEVLDVLLDSSLLQRHVSEGAVRLGMLETVRVYAADRLAALAPETQQRALAAHASYYAALGERLRGTRGPDAPARIQRLIRETPHLVAACRAAMAAGDGTTALTALETVRRVVVGQGPHELMLALSEQLYALSSLPPRQRAHATFFYGYALAEERPQEAREVLERALVLSEELGAHELADKVRQELAMVLVGLGQPEQARVYFEKLVQSADPARRASPRRRLAMLAQIAGAFPQAAALYVSACEDARACQDQFGVGMALNGLVWAAIRQGQLEEAVPMLDEAERIFQAFGAKIGVLHLHATRGQILARRGERPRALPLMREAVEGFRALGDRRSMLILELELGGELLEEGLHEEALRYLTEAEQLAHDLRDARGLEGSRMLRGHLMLAMGQPEAALRILLPLREDQQAGGVTAVSLSTDLAIVNALLSCERWTEASARLAEIEQALADRGLGPTTEMGMEVVNLKEKLQEGRKIRSWAPR
jgi:predicted ATPase/DNA-binding winged helix-turn-helix (wHTH) protein